MTRCKVRRGTGECQACSGSGTNTALNSDQDRCPQCQGTGRCMECRPIGITTLNI